jgi:putative chitinase
MTITAHQLHLLMPNNPDSAGWAAAFNDAFSKFEIVTPIQQAQFLAQVGHESMDMRAVVENLNYAAEALGKKFRKYFPQRDEASFHRQPERIANRIYANRMGNGNEASGDGWRFRGRGPIQQTGRNNYAAFMAASGIDVIANPELLEQPATGAAGSAFWWRSNNANAWADDVEAASRLVNLGNARSTAVPHGMDDRRARFARAKQVFGL